MLSVCMLEKKQRLASHLNVCGFRTEGKSEREKENKTERQKEDDEEEGNDNRV